MYRGAGFPTAAGDTGIEERWMKRVRGCAMREMKRDQGCALCAVRKNAAHFPGYVAIAA